MKAIFVLTIGICLLGSCRNVRTSQSIGRIAEQQDLYRCTVSFISIGSGIDKDALQKFLLLISRYKDSTGKKLIFESVSWGREGERDYCLRLSELTSEQQGAFIRELRDLLGSSTRVRLAENVKCRN
jgi:hypothetical protein